MNVILLNVFRVVAVIALVWLFLNLTALWKDSMFKLTRRIYFKKIRPKK